MTNRQVSTDDEPTAIYEIRLKGSSPEPLRQQFPTASVFRTRTETVLFRRVEEPADLDTLLDRLLSMGLVLTAVHEVRRPHPSVGEPPESSSVEGLPSGHHI